jgi:hypothetical protein
MNTGGWVLTLAAVVLYTFLLHDLARDLDDR